MNNYSIRQINADEYETVRQLDSDAFGYNERGSDGEFHRIFADNIRRSPYFIPKLDLVAVTNEGFILGHGIFSALLLGDAGNHVVWLNSLAIRHGEKDNHTEKKYEYQRKGKIRMKPYLQLNLLRLGLMARIGFLATCITIFQKLKMNGGLGYEAVYKVSKI